MSVSISLFSLSSKSLLLFQNQQLLRDTRALLVRSGEGSVSCGCRAAVRRACRYRVGVGTNRKGCVTRAPLQPAPRAAALTANPRANPVVMGVITPCSPMLPDFEPSPLQGLSFGQQSRC